MTKKEMMLRAVNELTMTVDLPLSIDSSYIDVVESALRIYPGRALINSISLEPEKFEKLIPIAKNMVLCLFCFLCRMPDFQKIWMRKNDYPYNIRRGKTPWNGRRRHCCGWSGGYDRGK